MVKSEDFTPQLNVLAVLSPDEGGIVEVLVQRTLPLEGSDFKEGPPDTVWYSDSTYHVWSTLHSLYRVNDAIVTLTEGTTFYDLAEAGDYDNWWDAARYIPVDSTFVPLSGVTYYLSVETPEGLAASGNCTIPPPVSIKADQLTDTLESGKTFTVAWNPATDYTRVCIEGLPEYSEYCSIWEEVVVCHDSSWTFRVIPDCWIEADGALPPYLELEISVTAMDEHYYNYFYGEADEEAVFYLLGEGDAGRSQGIEGGLGTFGSFRADTIQRWLAR